MKMFIALALISTSGFAQTWTETFKLPEGTTFRARMTGFDCGTFGTTYVGAPENIRAQAVEFRQLAADKDLNKFLIEADYQGTDGQKCIYGVFLDRNRDTKTLDINHSEVKTTEGLEAGCESTRLFIDTLFTASGYEGSKRGLRYIAVNVVADTANDVCESGTVRTVFDRRLVPESDQMK
ncbi:MAG: hypothetical protein V4598_09590 [Bdellovibrionota bacterium]